MAIRVEKATEIQENLHLSLRQSVIGAIETGVKEDEALAIVSNIVGMLIAMQDQRRYTIDQIMQIVTMNIHDGNTHFINTALGGVDADGRAS